jgi:hypothetical protein
MVATAFLLFPLLMQTSVTPAIAQPEVLTNEHIVRMVNAGLSADIIKAKIGVSACNFRTDTDALVALAEAKVPEPVILAMIACTPTAAAPPSPVVVAMASPAAMAAPAKTRPVRVMPTPRPPAPSLTLPATFAEISYKLARGGTCEGTLTLTEKGFEYRTTDTCTEPVVVPWSTITWFCYRPVLSVDSPRRITFFGRVKDQWLFWTDSADASELEAVARLLRKVIHVTERCN